ncbi:predicted protein [Plenodomus lingam JN3]|uniref:Predicted protein n=1 Tax=Leptosphaeria maculans (strain JN3 / isolate v23.1.3 / race Av1-4-5-6-7-8) TaxID=985895 RepID=E5R451_LEPMJ|nr:predicted protein [Plenodomus lingam JN3]CBX91782.1 predicted protein [Plenodomus lingam JN3]
MCDAYKKRNTPGKQKSNTCPDCQYTKESILLKPHPEPASCQSPDYHLGGDEVHYYCKKAQADGSRCETPRAWCEDHYCTPEDDVVG